MMTMPSAASRTFAYLFPSLRNIGHGFHHLRIRRPLSGIISSSSSSLLSFSSSSSVVVSCAKGETLIATHIVPEGDCGGGQNPKSKLKLNNVVEILEERGLLESLTSEKLRSHCGSCDPNLPPLRVYCGFDPTAGSLHLGNLLGIIVLSWFLRCGHSAIALVGGATAQVGDPSGKSLERPELDPLTIQTNTDAIVDTLYHILGGGFPSPSFAVLNNYDWWKEFKLLDFLKQVGRFARVGTMMSKESVRRRLESEQGMSYTEFTYQLLQGYDFVHLFQKEGINVQIGGSDQWGNITAGTDLIRRIIRQDDDDDDATDSAYGLTFPLLLKSDGTKFGKSEEGAIWLSPSMLSPYKFYQHFFSVPDADVVRFLKRLTFLSMDEIAVMERKMQAPDYVPNSAQRLLAEEVTCFVHGQLGLDEAFKATEALKPGGAENVGLDWETIQQIAEAVPSCSLPFSQVLNLSIIDLSISSGLLESKSAARRLLKQGGLYLNNTRVDNESKKIQTGDIVEGKVLLLSAGRKNRIVPRVFSSTAKFHPIFNSERNVKISAMGEWLVGAIINLLGSIAINFGTNLLKLGHDETEKHAVLGSDGSNGKSVMKPVIYFHTWRVGILFFALGNCLNFISFGYAAQSLLAALGSVQFVSNIAFVYFVLNKTVTVRVLIATAFIVLGNVFLVAFGNHQSPVYTTEQLAEKYTNLTFLLYCLILLFIVVLNHYVYRRGELLLAVCGRDLKPYWHLLLPFSYAIVSGAVGSCSVLFAKSISNLLRLSMSSGSQLHNWFTYSMFLLFLSTAGFWMARLNEGLSLFDAICIVPMFQIAWTFFSICTGFVYFQEYQVFDALRTTMFVLGMISVFVGISLLAPDDTKGTEVKDAAIVSVASSSISSDVDRLVVPSEGNTQVKDMGSFLKLMHLKAADLVVKATAACSVFLGLGEHSIHASSVLVMPMVSSKITGFRGCGFDRSKFSLGNSGWSKVTGDEEGLQMLETTSMLTQAIE